MRDEFRRGALVDLDGAVGGEREPVGIPVGEEVGDDRKPERDQHAVRPAEHDSRRRRTAP